MSMDSERSLMSVDSSEEVCQMLYFQTAFYKIIFSNCICGMSENYMAKRIMVSHYVFTL
jgi:hypothetical protein